MEQKPTIIRKLNNARAVWLFAGAFFLGSGSLVGVAWANSKKLVGYLALDTIITEVQASEERRNKTVMDQLEEMTITQKEQQIELYSLLSEAIPEFKKAAEKRIEQKQAGELIKRAVDN